jgi:hypothetical protein
MLYGLEKASCPKPCFAKVVPLTDDEASAARIPKFDCRDTAEGDLCYSSITWLREAGFQLYPDWYPGLSTNSSTSEIQAELHRKGKADCTWPCALKVEEEVEEKQRTVWEAGEIKDESRSVPQYASRYTSRYSRKGIVETTTQPEEYAVEDNDVQTTTQHKEDAVEDNDCMDAQPNTQCYNDVAYGMAEGIKLHESLYEGLTMASHFKQIQEHLYLNNRSGCERPCHEEQVDVRELADRPGGLRQLKRVEDMNIKELSEYLNGDWDGYVAKQFQSKMKGTTSTFARRLYNPVTTTVLEEALPLPVIESRKTAKAEAASETESASGAKELEKAAEATDTVDSIQEAAAPDVSEDGLPVEKVVPTTEAASRVLECLRNMAHEVTPDNFAYRRAECESVMARELPETGEQRDLLTKESMRYFVWAVRHVDEMKTKWKAVAGPQQELVPASEAAYEVMACLQKLSVGYVTLDNFPLSIAECTDVMTKNMPNTGEQRDALYKEAMNKFNKAQRYVDWMKAQEKDTNSTQDDTVVADSQKVVDAVVTDADSQKVVEAVVTDADYKNVVDAVVTDDPMPMIDADGQNSANEMPMIDDDGQKSAIDAMPMLDDDGKSLESESMPMLDDDGQNLETQAGSTSGELSQQPVNSSQESEKEDAIVSKPQPLASEKPQYPVETPGEIEQRIRKQVLEEAAAKTTTAAPHRETEEEMRERIKAEVVRELGKKIRDEVLQQRTKAQAQTETSQGQ